MKYVPLILMTIVTLCSCNRMQSDVSLDELEDRTEYTGGMIVGCEYFRGEKVDHLMVNQDKYTAPEVLDLRDPGYYRIEVFTTAPSSVKPEIIRLVILDTERGDAEWGLPVWTPAGMKTGILAEQEVSLIYPQKVPEGFSFPLIVKVGGQLGSSMGNFEGRAGSGEFRIKRGVGSTWVPPFMGATTPLKIGDRSFDIITRPLEGPPRVLSGVLAKDSTIIQGSFVWIQDDLSIPSGITLTLEAGVYVMIDPGVNIYYEGTVLIEGNENAPVTITCAEEGEYWGGMIGSSSGNRMEASYAILSRSGYHTGGAYDYGHAHRQALFYSEYGSLSLDHCYMTDHIGQVFFPVSASLEIKYCLVQRAKTGGQVNASRLLIDHCVFTDFPDDLNHFQDEDNDGLYLMECQAEISHSIFMYARDDGLDSGGSGGGSIQVTHTRFESVFHEGAALSSGGSVTKEHRFSQCVFMDCGQGLELGYSSPHHQVVVDSCSFLNNGIGIRYGDNYTTPHQGKIYVSNSESLNNIEYDIWNMVREDWTADTSHMVFHNVSVTRTDPMYPLLKIHE